MNGAESLVRTLVAGDVNVCFTNPGTSEMHFVAALDRVDGMRCILGLFEGVVTGAADGYYRMKDSPASTLLHLGPGLSNGLANLHNAKKASSGIINIVGQHATYHIAHNAPLTSDIEGIAHPVSDWVRTSPAAKSVARDGADAIAAAKGVPGQIATLILPADTAWNNAESIAQVGAIPTPEVVSTKIVDEVARILKSGEPALLLLSHRALREDGLALAACISGRTGCKVMGQCFNPRIARGAGRYSVERLPYVLDLALAALKKFRHVILVEAVDPVAFFAYPNKPSLIRPDGCGVQMLCDIGGDSVGALRALAEAVGARATDVRPQNHPPLARPSGGLNHGSIAQAIAAAIPENAIVVDEAVTTGRSFFTTTAGAAPHDWLQNMGGSIGFGTPAATGAAVACPDRHVICMVGDGSAMYTLQSLWTQAREGLHITTIIFANRTYEILKSEFSNVEAGKPGKKAMDMMNIDCPTLDWVSLAKGMGVPGVSVTSADEFNRALSDSIAAAGPQLIECVI